VKQIVQPLAGGPVEVLDVPRPVPDATEVLVRTVASVGAPLPALAEISRRSAGISSATRGLPAQVADGHIAARRGGVLYDRKYLSSI